MDRSGNVSQILKSITGSMQLYILDVEFIDITQYSVVLIGCRARQEDPILTSDKYITVSVTCHTFGTVFAWYFNTMYVFAKTK
jgi:hypothetical protein